MSEKRGIFNVVKYYCKTALDFMLLNYRQIPVSVRKFLLRGILLFALWQLVYQFFLFENRIVDAPLTHHTALITVEVLDWLYVDDVFFATHHTELDTSIGVDRILGYSLVWVGKRPLINIADACNGLAMYALFLGFILAYPGSWRLKLGFGGIGLVVLIGVNIVRCVGLAILQIHYPAFTLFAHHYLFNVMTYAAVFALWYYFTLKSNK